MKTLKHVPYICQNVVLQNQPYMSFFQDKIRATKPYFISEYGNIKNFNILPYFFQQPCLSFPNLQLKSFPPLNLAQHIFRSRSQINFHHEDDVNPYLHYSN